MPGPLAPYLETIRAVNVEGAMDPETLRRVIALSESVGAVVLRRGNYRIDPHVERSFVPEAYRPLIAAAVARANCEPATPREREAATIYGAGLEGLDKAIERAVKIVPGIADLAADLETLFGGATLQASWWGVQAVLSGAAAVAFCKLPEHDLNTILSALAPFFPKAAVLLAFTVPAGAVAKLWIDQVQGFVRSRTVKLELLFWVVPWVGPADENRASHCSNPPYPGGLAPRKLG